MKLFGQKCSTKFSVFIRQQESELGLRIVFSKMERHHIDHYYEDLLGTYELDDKQNILKVYVNVALIKNKCIHPDSKEVTAAHEVLHVWACRAGFPITKRPPEFPDDGPEAFVGSKIHSMVQHVAIDSKLQGHGFDPLIVQQEKGRDAIRRWESMDFTVLRKGSPKFVLETLDYMEGQLRYPAEIRNAAKTILSARNHALFSLGEQGLARIRESDCLQPDGALVALIKVRDLLELKPHGVLVFDPRDGRVY